MASPSTAHVRSLYRSLLRELPPRPILATPRSSIHLRIRDSFSKADKSAATATGDIPARDLQKTEQFAHYLRSQRLYVALVERYNPGMDMSEEERVRLTARRVGMDLPVEFEKRTQ